MTENSNKTPLFKHVGKPLPKRILRPFSYDPPYSIDDRKYKLIDINDRGHSIYGWIVFPYLVAFGGLLIVVISWASGKVTKWSHFDVPVPELTIVSFFVALLMHYFAKRLSKHPTKFRVFDREKGELSLYKGWLINKHLFTAPWEEWGARLWVASTSVGAAEHNLSLVHLPSNSTWILYSSMGSIEPLLGYWSFIVQYMDKNAPLPDIPDLEQYPNRTIGLGTWEDWKKSVRKSDPYDEWLVELKKDPTLDESNARIQANRGF
jgi:hypothetical protein